MTYETVLDAYRWGFHSNEWLLRQALPHVPRENLETAVSTQMYYILHADNLSVHTQLDILAQVALTGAYLPTAFPQEEPDGEVTPDGQLHNPDNSGYPITEDEIKRFGAMFERLVDPDAGPDNE